MSHGDWLVVTFGGVTLLMLGYVMHAVIHRPNPQNAILLQQAADEIEREQRAHEATTLRCSDAEARLAQISLLAAPRS